MRRWRSQLARAALVVLTGVCFIAAIRYMPIADAIGIAFAGPLFSVCLAGPLLGERIGWRRWTAAGVGFVGVLMMVNPGASGFTLAALLPLATALGGALRDVLTRHMSTGDHSNATLAVSTLAIVLIAGLTLPLGLVAPSQAWVWPSPLQWLLFALGGLLMGVAQYCLIESLRVAQVALVVPFKYMSYIWAVAFGFLVFGDVPQFLSLLGVALVIGGGLFIFWREQRLSRERARVQ